MRPEIRVIALCVLVAAAVVAPVASADQPAAAPASPGGSKAAVAAGQKEADKNRSIVQGNRSGPAPQAPAGTAPGQVGQQEQKATSGYIKLGGVEGESQK